MAHPTPDDLALIALGEDTDLQALEHVGECRACFAEIEALQQVVAIGRALGPEDRLVAPSPQVWHRIAEGLRTDRALQGGSVGLLEQPNQTQTSYDAAPAGSGRADELAARRKPASRRWLTVAVAAAVALIVGLTGGYFLKELVTPAPVASAVTQLNALPRWPGANGTATVETSSNGQRTLVVTMSLPATVSIDGTLEVWMSDTRAEDMLPMGTMTGSTARFPIAATTDLATHPIVDVSLEPRNDTNPAHSDISVVRGRLNV